MSGETSTAVDPFDLAAGVPDGDGPLRPKPRLSARISKRVVIVAATFVLLVLALWLFALDSMDNKPKHPASADDGHTTTRGEATRAPDDLLGSGPPSLAAAASKPEDSSATEDAPKIPAGSGVPLGLGKVPPAGNAGQPGGQVPPINGGAGQAVPMTPEQQAKLRAEEDRRQRLERARQDGMSAKAFNPDGGSGSGGLGTPDVSAGQARVTNARQSALSSAQANALGVGGAAPAGAGGQPASDQDVKLRFLKEAEASPSGYHKHVMKPPLSPYELKAGAKIPMALEGDVNSDLPGQMTARVTENVWDTVTGCNLLVPAMTEVIGRYDSKVAIGQERNLVVWNNAIFRDGSELNLAGMQGYSPSGMAGLEADVDNHWLRLFGVAFGMSMVTAGIQLSVPKPTNNANGTQTQTNSQVIATALAQQYGQLGAQMMGKYLQVQPTLRNYFGERFTVIVPQTIVFPRIWAKRC